MTDNKFDPSNNDMIFKDMVKRVRPDIYVLMDLMDRYNINEFVVFKFLRHIISINSGGGWGRIQLYIKNYKVQTIESIESDNVNETISRVSQEDKNGGGSIQKNTAEDHISIDDLFQSPK